MVTGQSSTVVNGHAPRGARQNIQSGKGDPVGKQVPVQVMVPESVRRQLAILSAERGESIRAVVLRALRGIGIKIEESQLCDRRGRRRQQRGKSDGAI